MSKKTTLFVCIRMSSLTEGPYGEPDWLLESLSCLDCRVTVACAPARPSASISDFQEHLCLQIIPPEVNDKPLHSFG